MRWQDFRPSKHHDVIVVFYGRQAGRTVYVRRAWRAEEYDERLERWFDSGNWDTRKLAEAGARERARQLGKRGIVVIPRGR